MHVQVRSLITTLSEAALSRQASDGSMPSGCNGPYGHSETALRNTGHWLLLWLAVFRWSGDERYEQAAASALDYMRSPQHRPNQANWLQREQLGKDRCNGVIGAAWTIEALLGAYQHYKYDDLLSTVVDVWSQHKFASDTSLWHRLEVDGRIQKIDQTFNHQLWFAAAISPLAALGIEGVLGQLKCFMDGLEANFTCHRSGVIRHRVRMKWLDYIFDSGTIPHRLHERYKQIKSGARRGLDPEKRDVGYHAFNLHAFAKLKLVFPRHPFWDSAPFQRALQYAGSEAFIQGIANDNPYAYGYNPVGFEMAVALREFVPDSEIVQREWIARQLDCLGGRECAQYGENTDDPETARARIYEALELF
ncbi:hypothetical protein QEH52_00695 [Coraliomargarita sp. SDUM461003]|uniref:Agl cluster protein AglQ n=1 Tax=Thalassobacterium maritimum TaxID=3041265 RepID=A0ABU1AQV4_9BACT|nr:hypothetical protein [Coraliomargarita sp. SDUM461003]MDQ8206012.1 hypothetical protein [Coraliomargarita sp. SDUM461003]